MSAIPTPRPASAGPSSEVAAVEKLKAARESILAEVRKVIVGQTDVMDYLLIKTAELLDRLLVYPDRMQKNLDSTGGLVFSGQLLLDLVESGVSREDAYRIVQRNAMRAWTEGLNFRELVAADPDIAGRVPREQIERAFELDRQLRNVDKIFVRVFGREHDSGNKGTTFRAAHQARKKTKTKAAGARSR